MPPIRKHLLLITPRIEFTPELSRPLPTITARMEFDDFRCNLVDDGPPGGVHEDSEEEQPGETPKETTGTKGKGKAKESPRARADSPSATSSSNEAGGSQTRSEKIPKPTGEPGRPNSGGYALESMMINDYGWTKETFDDITADVKKLAARHLDVTQSYKFQAEAKIQKVCEKIIEDWQDLELQNFEKCWPVRDMLKMRLKYSSEHGRLTQAKNQQGRIKEIIG